MKFKAFQKEDLARAALRDSAIIAWEPGLGKTLAAFAWPTIKASRRTLIVAPEGIHDQIYETGRDFFGRVVWPLRDQDDFFRWNLHLPPRTETPKFWLTTYTQLALNGADEWPVKLDREGFEMPSPQHTRKQRREWARAHGISWKNSEWLWKGIGESMDGVITCLRKPSVARLAAMYDSFDCVVIDEGVRLQANDSKTSIGIRLLNPKYKLILTATPIKNRLESFFWLAWWAGGAEDDASIMWPYPPTSEAREQFASQHLQHDRFVTREKEVFIETKRRRKIERRSSRICNIHRLWKLIGPIVIRRRKVDCGEDIVSKTFIPIRVPPGERQLEVYQYHLDHPPLYSKDGNELNQRQAAGVQLMALRTAAACPDAPQLGEFGSYGPWSSKVSPFSMTPKMAAVLKVVRECLDRGEQIICGSPFVYFNHRLFRYLSAIGVNPILLDGSVAPSVRGALARRFKDGEFRVMLAGQKAMGEGNSFECCSNLVLPAIDFAYDINAQFVDRVHRINSPKPVRIYTVVTEGTVDERLDAMFREKSDSAHLALDGALISEEVEELNMQLFLERLVKEFKDDRETIPEQDMQEQFDSEVGSALATV